MGPAFGRRILLMSRLLPRSMSLERTFFHGDCWISFFLASRGIAIRRLRQAADNSPIYEAVYMDENSLHRLKDTLFRNALHREGLKRLIREVDMPIRRRLRLAVNFAFDLFIVQPLQRTRRLVKKVIVKMEVPE